ncbi:MAG: DUF4476 domain-containing protein [Ferruginibacter sp.]
MKKFSTILSAVFLSVALFASAPLQSRLSISTTGINNFRIMLDGSFINSPQSADGEIMINNIRAGNHNLKIYGPANGYDNRGYDNRRNNNRRTQQLQLLYDGNIYVKPQYDVDVIINRFGKAFVDEQRLDDNVYGNGNNGNWNNNNSGGWNNNTAMNARDFMMMKQTIGRENFEATRLSIAKQAISGNYFSAQQVMELMQLFSYENNKLDTAKYAYRFAADKNNYYQVADALGYSVSKEELMRYIQQNR